MPKKDNKKFNTNKVSNSEEKMTKIENLKKN